MPVAQLGIVRMRMGHGSDMGIPHAHDRTQIQLPVRLKRMEFGQKKFDCRRGQAKLKCGHKALKYGKILRFRFPGKTIFR